MSLVAHLGDGAARFVTGSSSRREQRVNRKPHTRLPDPAEVASHGIAHHARLLQALSSSAVISRCHRGQEICSQSCAAENWYCLISGVARRYVIRADGRRQIVDLLLPGDFFGFTAGDEYDFAVEAIIEGTRVAGYSRRRVECIADSDPQLARELRHVAFEALSRLQSQLVIVGRVTAQEKVSSFLLEMAARLSDGDADHVVLPMSRYDIADYLAVSVETVSRALTELKHRGFIRLSGARTVSIVDREALEETPHEFDRSRHRHARSPAHFPQPGRPATVAA
jgi:CRP/FNR family nitrogen fixation transcriptional regulator